MDTITIGNRLRARREYLRLSRREVGDALGITETGYGHYETGKRTVSAPDLAKIARILRVNISYFYEEDAYPLEAVPGTDLPAIPGIQYESAQSGQITERLNQLDKKVDRIFERLDQIRYQPETCEK